MSILEFVESMIFWFAVWGLTLIVIDKVAEIHANREWTKRRENKNNNKKEGAR